MRRARSGARHERPRHRHGRRGPAGGDRARGAGRPGAVRGQAPPRRRAYRARRPAGINAALGTMDPEDSWEQHAADTLREGYWLGDPVSVELLCREAPAAIDDLVRWGARLAREEDGRLTQRYFGAHRYRRTCFAGDYTGREIQRTLVAPSGGARGRDPRRRLRHAPARARGPRLRRLRLRRRRREPPADPRRRGRPRRRRPHAHLAPLLLPARREHRRRDAARRRGGLPPAGHGARPVPPHRDGLSRRSRRGRSSPRPCAARAGSCATPPASASWSATTRSGSSSPPATASPSPTTRRSPRAAEPSTEACCSTSRISTAT